MWRKARERQERATYVKIERTRPDHRGHPQDLSDEQERATRSSREPCNER
jgi:hypothetical protein